MTTMSSFFFFIFFIVSSLSLLCIARAQDRAPHGLAYENPLVLSPSAIEFFHPKSSKPNAANAPSFFSSSNAVAESTLAHESKLSTSSSNTNGSRVGVGGVVGIVFGFVLAVLLAMGVYYVVITRQTNATRANSVQPDV